MANLKINGNLEVTGRGLLNSQNIATFSENDITEATPARYDNNAYRYVGTSQNFAVELSGYIDSDVSTSISDQSGISIELDLNGIWTTVIKQVSVNGYAKFVGVSYIIPPYTQYRISAWGLRSSSNQLKIFIKNLLTYE